MPMWEGRTGCESSDLSTSVEVCEPGEPLGGSPVPSNSVDVETLDGSMLENITRNDKETLTPATMNDPDSMPNEVNRDATCKWRIQLKNCSPTTAKSCKIKPKSQKRVPNTKTNTGGKELGTTPAVSVTKTKEKTKGKKAGKKSIRWSDLMLPDSVQQFFDRNSAEIKPVVQSQENVHLKCDTSTNSKGKSACKTRREKKGRIPRRINDKEQLKFQ